MISDEVFVQAPNKFEEKTSDFSVDTLGYGNKKFEGCTDLHKLIGEYNLDEIESKSDWLTKKALGMTCK